MIHLYAVGRPLQSPKAQSNMSKYFPKRTVKDGKKKKNIQQPGFTDSTHPTTNRPACGLNAVKRLVAAAIVQRCF
jgi:hypothetical protein